MADLHRHDEASTWDGFGSAKELAKIAKSKGYTWLGTSNHGTIAGNVKHYKACKENGIKPVLGVEAYHMPVLKTDGGRGYHLCLFAKNLKGYENLNRIMTEAQETFYYKAQVTFKTLKKYHEGVIVTTACVGSYTSQAILADKPHLATNWLVEMKSIFGDDLYIELQPYKVDDEGKQERINHYMAYLGEKHKIKTILTSDSHRGLDEDYDSYEKLMVMANKDAKEVYDTYSERYMPDLWEMEKRFVKMHSKGRYKIPNTKAYAKRCHQNIEELVAKVEDDIMDQIDPGMPVFNTEWTKERTKKQIIAEVKKGLKRIGKENDKEYVKRAQEELKVINTQGFNDYFLIVQDYALYARNNGIAIGVGRGSVCNSLVAYLMNITEIDSIQHKLDFNRFMRIGKNKIPDIDLDFGTEQRQQIMDYLVRRYPGRASKIGTYGMYKVDNLINELTAKCGADDAVTEIKRFVKNELFVDGELIPLEEATKKREYKAFNDLYDNIIYHYYKMYSKIKYYGVHASGVVIAPHEITKYCALRYVRKKDVWATEYDLYDLEEIGIVKFDVLGLETLDAIVDMRKQTGVTKFDQAWLTDPKIIKKFRDGETPGVFQFDNSAPRKIMEEIQVDCFNDIVAVNAMNRPSSLSMGMPEQYAQNKLNKVSMEDKPYYEYVKETYGCILYQEQVLAISINLGGFTPDEADILVKMEHGAESRTKKELDDKYYRDFKKKFVTNAVKNGVDKADALELFNACSQYGFNKGHAAAYALTSVEEAYYLTYHPVVYFFSKIKHAKKDDGDKFCAHAHGAGIAVFIPHINFSDEQPKITKFEGENVILKGLTDLKGVGLKAATHIVLERNEGGKFSSYNNFVDRCKSQSVNAKVIKLLSDNGCIDVKMVDYFNRVEQYNTSLNLRSGGSKRHGRTNKSGATKG